MCNVKCCAASKGARSVLRGALRSKQRNKKCATQCCAHVEGDRDKRIT